MIHKYEKESLGRMAVFLLPSLKLKIRDEKGETIEEKIHQFLLVNFNGYTAATGNIFGFWKNSSGQEFYGEHKEYKVSFIGKERIPILENFLACVAMMIDEHCIYFETGEDSWLIYPAY
ncbi:MAG: hypothetical protein AAB397_04120 [Patescibacteria group bacterium]